MVAVDPTAGFHVNWIRKNNTSTVHQVRTIDLRRVRAFTVGGEARFVTDKALRRGVRAALARHFGLDVPATADGA